jgi:hypothetical protein
VESAASNDSRPEVQTRPVKGERVLGLVKDGTFYEAYRSPTGHLVIVDTKQAQLPVIFEEHPNVRLARLDCGDNCYIIDHRIIRETLRRVREFANLGTENLVLDISRVSLVARSHLNALRSLAVALRSKGRDLIVTTASAIVAREVCAAAPELQGLILPRLEEAMVRARQPRVSEAAG